MLICPQEIVARWYDCCAFRLFFVYDRRFSCVDHGYGIGAGRLVSSLHWVMVRLKRSALPLPNLAQLATNCWNNPVWISLWMHRAWVWRCAASKALVVQPMIAFARVKEAVNAIIGRIGHTRMISWRYSPNGAGREQVVAGDVQGGHGAGRCQFGRSAARDPFDAICPADTAQAVTVTPTMPKSTVDWKSFASFAVIMAVVGVAGCCSLTCADSRHSLRLNLVSMMRNCFRPKMAFPGR